MPRIYKVTALAVLFSLCFTSCQKELSEENNQYFMGPAAVNDVGSSSGTAAFILEGAPATCNNYMIGGTYTAGSALIETNSVDVDVLVTDTGSYSISTARINGISFSASGMFHTTGRQTILLSGSGTPVAAGTFNYKRGSVCCSFPATVSGGFPGPPASGVLACSSAWSEGTFTHGVAVDSVNKIYIPVNVTTAGYYSIRSAPFNGTMFSGSGILQAGNQVVTLTGNGIPRDAGAYVMAVSFGPNTCSLYITYQ